MDIKKDLLLWFTNFLVKGQKVVILIMRLNNIDVLWTSLHYNQLKNYTNQLLKNLEKEHFILDLS